MYSGHAKCLLIDKQNQLHTFFFIINARSGLVGSYKKSMTPKVKEILENYSYYFESKTKTHRPISKKELLIKLGAQESSNLVKVEPDKYGYYPKNAFYIVNEDGNGGDYYIDEFADITDEEYEELLPYVALSESIKPSKRSNHTLMVTMFIIWILNIIGCITIIFTPLEPMIKWSIIIGILIEVAFFQVFANAIFENAENNKKTSDSIVSLGIQVLKKNMSQNPK